MGRKATKFAIYKKEESVIQTIKEPIVPAIAVDEAVKQYCQPITDEVNRRLVTAEAMFKKGLAELKILSDKYGMNIASDSIKKENCRLSVNVLFETAPEEIYRKNEQKAVEILVKGIMEKK